MSGRVEWGIEVGLRSNRGLWSDRSLFMTKILESCLSNRCYQETT